MRPLPAFLAMVLLAGCLSGGQPMGSSADGSVAPDPPEEGAKGRVFFRTVFAATPVREWTADVVVQPGARNVTLGVGPGDVEAPVHVALEGCGEADVPAAAQWVEVPLCEAPAPGLAVLSVSVGEGSLGRDGTVQLRADLPPRR